MIANPSTSPSSRRSQLRLNQAIQFGLDNQLHASKLSTSMEYISSATQQRFSDHSINISSPLGVHASPNASPVAPIRRVRRDTDNDVGNESRVCEAHHHRHDVCEASNKSPIMHNSAPTHMEDDRTQQQGIARVACCALNAEHGKATAVASPPICQSELMMASRATNLGNCSHFPLSNSSMPQAHASRVSWAEGDWTETATATSNSDKDTPTHPDDSHTQSSSLALPPHLKEIPHHAPSPAMQSMRICVS